MMNQFRTKNMAVSRLLTAVFILIAAALQTTLIRSIEVFHVVPNVLFIIVISYGLLNPDYSSLAVGIFCGLILDLTGGRIVGLNTLLCTYTAYFCLSVSDSLFNNNFFVSMVFVLLLSIPYELLIYLFYFVIWGEGAWRYAVFCKILPAVVYNFLFTAVVYPCVRMISGRNRRG